MKKYKVISWGLWLITGLMLVWGYIMQKTTSIDEIYLKSFIPIALVGLLLGIFCVHCKCSVYSIMKKKAPVFYVCGIVSMLLLGTFLGVDINETRRWLGWNDFRIVRPATILLVSTILIMGYLAEKNKNVPCRGIFDTLTDWLFEERNESLSLIIKERIKSFFSVWYKVLIPVISAFLMMQYDVFISSYLVMAVIMVFFSLLFEKSLSRKIIMAVFWTVFGIGSVYSTEFYLIYYLKNRSEFAENAIPLEMGIAENMVLAAFLFVLVIGVFYVFVAAKKKEDVFGMAVTSLIGVHFASLVVLCIVTHILDTPAIVRVPFLPGDSFDTLIYIFEIVMVQSVLKENKREENA